MLTLSSSKPSQIFHLRFIFSRVENINCYIGRFTCKRQFVAKVHQFGLLCLLIEIFIECLPKEEL